MCVSVKSVTLLFLEVLPGEPGFSADRGASADAGKRGMGLALLRLHRMMTYVNVKGCLCSALDSLKEAVME